MNLLSKIQNKYIIAKSDEGSIDSDIEKLLHFSTIEVPHEYIEIIKEKTEIEIEINKKKYLRIWGAEGCMEMNEFWFIMNIS